MQTDKAIIKEKDREIKKLRKENEELTRQLMLQSHSLAKCEKMYAEKSIKYDDLKLLLASLDETDR